jgi:uncharacterized damage-inducible protein DinB
MEVTKAEIYQTEYKPYYDLYLQRVPLETTLLEALDQKEELINFFNTLPKNKLGFRYAPNKWTPKQILQHLIDTERIFMNRALSFDENDYAEHCFSNHRTLEDLLEEFQALRISSIYLFKSFENEMLTNIGQASGGPFSVRVLPFILCGHQKHHIHIIKERYL